MFRRGEELTWSLCSAFQLADCCMNQYKGHTQDRPQVLPFQQKLLGNGGSNLEVRKKWKKNLRQTIITPRSRGCPLTVSLKSERTIWDKKGYRQSHTLLPWIILSCFLPVHALQQQLRAVEGISNRLGSLPLLTCVLLRHWQQRLQQIVSICSEYRSCVQLGEAGLLQRRGDNFGLTDLTDLLSMCVHAKRSRDEHSSTSHRATELSWLSLPFLFSLPLYIVKPLLTTLHKNIQGSSGTRVSSTPQHLTTHTTCKWRDCTKKGRLKANAAHPQSWHSANQV